jgi:opacity protein-like surface antigen
MKSLLSIISLVATCGLSMSAHASWVGNWLMGASWGYAEQEAGFRTNVSYVTPTNLNNVFPITTIVRDHSDVGFVWSLLVGYQVICRQWLVGMEFNVDWRDIEETHPFAFTDALPFLNWIGSERYERKRIGALTGRLGYAIRPYFMPFVRFGIELGKDRFQTNFALNPLQTPFSSEFEDRHWTHRFLTGLGFEIPLPHTCGATFRMEYNYSSKGRTIESEQEIALPPLIGQTPFTVFFDSAMQPYTQSWKGSLVWNFF